MTVYRHNGPKFNEYNSGEDDNEFSVVYPVVVLILLPTSSLFIYSVSYISLY